MDVLGALAVAACQKPVAAADVFALKDVEAHPCQCVARTTDIAQIDQWAGGCDKAHSIARAKGGGAKELIISIIHCQLYGRVLWRASIAALLLRLEFLDLTVKLFHLPAELSDLPGQFLVFLA